MVAKLAMQPCTYGKTYEEAIAGYLEYCQEESLLPPRPTPVAV